jgi:paraquat-inducible protein B
MSKKANPALIGAFVIGAVVLLAAGLMAFGGAKLFQDKTRYVTYFEGSVKGLRVGSNLNFRGVPIGYVTDIQIVLNAGTLNMGTLVTLETTPKVVRVIREGQVTEAAMGALGMSVDELIKAGLRTQLDVESFVTGQLVVDVDFHPDEPAVFRVTKPRYPEIPSIPSNIQQVLARLQRVFANVEDKVPIEQIVTNLEGTLAGLNRLANSPDLQETLAGMNRLANAQEMQDLPRALRATISDLQETSRALRELAKNVEERVVPAFEGVGPVFAQLKSTLEEAERTVRATRRQLESNPETAAQLTSTLKEVEGAARALRVLVDYLERNPEALLRGKPNP